MSHSRNRERVAAISAAPAHCPQTLLPVLHEIHDAFVHISLECTAQATSALNVSRTEVQEVAFR